MSARRQHCSPATICTWLRRGGWAEERRGVGSSPPRRDLSNRLLPHFEYSGTIAECDVLIEVVGRVRRAENHGAVQEAAHIRNTLTPPASAVVPSAVFIGTANRLVRVTSDVNRLEPSYAVPLEVSRT